MTWPVKDTDLTKLGKVPRALSLVRMCSLAS